MEDGLTSMARPRSPSHISADQHMSREDAPTIRLVPHSDPRSSRPSLTFPPTSRTVPNEKCVVRIGRYSERDTPPQTAPELRSFAPIGFKSKVVSRRHCELWCSNGQWYIRDVKSSSGTFLNHIRLSQANTESRPFPVNDGDVVQLGIDFRGGEEMIFRCVKIRIECNRNWQKTLNKYNVSTYKHLRDLGKSGVKDSDSVSTHSSQECAICLMSIAPCQSLFVAPCSHVWHYRCIRPILNDHRTYPQFLCPNCRAVTDLEAELDESPAMWDGSEERNRAIMADPHDVEISDTVASYIRNNTDDTSQHPMEALPSTEYEDMHPAGMEAGTNEGHMNRANQLNSDSNIHGVSQCFDRDATPSNQLDGREVMDSYRAGMSLDRADAGTPMVERLNSEGPTTPTNSAGPFVFDGSASG